MKAKYAVDVYGFTPWWDSDFLKHVYKGDSFNEAKKIYDDYVALGQTANGNIMLFQTSPKKIYLKQFNGKYPSEWTHNKYNELVKK
jgi:hypothetical protein